MKRIGVILVIVFIVFIMISKEEEVMIPKEAIRFRVIANSDSDVDQLTKTLVRNEIQEQLATDMKENKTIKEARKKINDNLTTYSNLVEKTLKSHEVDYGYEVNYGMNYFPQKTHKGVNYQEGYYESLVVTLGSGEGKNWWCVLFPPLCLLEAEETNQKEEVEYKFFIKEIIDKYL